MTPLGEHAGDEYRREALPNDVRRVLVPGAGGPGFAGSDWSSLSGLCVARWMSRVKMDLLARGQLGGPRPRSLVDSLRRDRVLAGGPDGPALRG